MSEPRHNLFYFLPQQGKLFRELRLRCPTNFSLSQSFHNRPLARDYDKLKFVGHFLTVVQPTFQAFSCSILGSWLPTNGHSTPTLVAITLLQKAGLISRGRSATGKMVVAIFFQGPHTHGQIHGAAKAAKNFAQPPLPVKPNLTFSH